MGYGIHGTECGVSPIPEAQSAAILVFKMI